MVDTNEAPVFIIGAGPTGLGAAWRLHELGFDNWLLLEQSGRAGGLASSFTDDKGFTWDVGVHVHFSHYEYYDQVLDTLLSSDQWTFHDRESVVFLRDRFVSYPFQYNLHQLDEDDCWECLSGIIDTQNGQMMNGKGPQDSPSHFKEWIQQGFGSGIARLFMEPYNLKAWAHPLEMMGFNWIGERVAVLDLKRAIETVVRREDRASWGPNSKFRYPTSGGTGRIWQTLADRLPSEKVCYHQSVQQIDPASQQLQLADGRQLQYSQLLSTMPIPRLVETCQLQEELPQAANLRHSSVHVVGIGLKGQPPAELEGICWIYVPDPDLSFHRVTILSNYSPNNVPAPGEMWSLLCEISASPYRKIDGETVVTSVIADLVKSGFIEDQAAIVTQWHYLAPYGYPTPSVERDDILNTVLPGLAQRNIYTRGRFGAWKYEVSNQDHSFMQGVEFADRVADDTPELTVFSPHIVNSGPKRVGPKATTT